MSEERTQSRRSVFFWLLVLGAAVGLGVAGSFLLVPGRAQLRITAYALTPEEKASMARVRPSELRRPVLWQRTIELSRTHPVQVMHITGAHTMELTFTSTASRSGRPVHAVKAAESFGSFRQPNPFGMAASFGPGTWGYGWPWLIPLATMTPAEAAGRQPDQTETVYGWETVDSNPLWRWFRAWQSRAVSSRPMAP